jgi:hypothetical protein
MEVVINTRLSLPSLVVMKSKSGAGPSTFPDETGIDNDRPEIFELL